MKTLKILVASSLLFTSANILAEGYSVAKLKEMICSMDDNSDKKITFEEFFDAEVTDNSDSYDTNKDGYITEDEIALEMKENLIETVAELKKHGVSEADTNATVVNELNAIDKESAAIIDAMDTDNDNLVEPEELKAYQEKTFKALDSNRDGLLSESDLSVKKHSNYTYKPYRP